MRSPTLSRRGLAALLALMAVAVPAVSSPAPAAAREPDVACAVGQPSQAPQPSAAELDAREHLHSFATGRGVRVAVIDTGISAHPQLERLEAGGDFVTPDEPDPLTDCDLHGTVVAGVIAGRDLGVAPAAELISIRQTSAHYRYRTEEEVKGAGTLATLAAAIDKAVELRAKVINISVVSCVPRAAAGRVDTAGLDAAVRRAEDAGAVIVAATGNASSAGCAKDDVVFPATAPTVLAVGALATEHEVADYSIPGPSTAPELSARGFVPLALSPSGGWATAKIPGGDSSSPAATEPTAFHGTSFAAPVVSGTVALLAERYPTDSAARLRERIHAAAEPGHGVVDPLAALTVELSSRPTPSHAVRITPRATHASIPAARVRILMVLAGILFCAAALAASSRRRRKAATPSA